MQLKDSESISDLVVELFHVGAVKIQDVTLKTGSVSPIYIDLRVIVSYPKLLTIAVAKEVPMVVKRKEAKSYGTMKMIEGYFKQGDTALIVEDVLTSGTSVLETVSCLIQSGLKVKDALIILDRDQFGLQNLQKMGINVHCIFQMSQVLSILVEKKLIPIEKQERITQWLTNNPSKLSSYSLTEYRLVSKAAKPRLPFNQRKELTTNPLTKKLFDIIHSKKSNLCVSADFQKSADIISLVTSIGPYICMVKVHSDSISDFSEDSFIKPLVALSKEHNFLIFEDRKFADIGTITRDQYVNGLHKISQWANLVTTHITPGPGIISGLKEGATSPSSLGNVRGCVIVAQMSSSGQLLTKATVEAAYELQEKNGDFISGFITQNRITDNPAVVHMTPGVKMADSGEMSDSLGQQYLTPEKAVANGADLIIVGRGITSAADKITSAKQYQEAAFSAYEKLSSI